MNGFAGKVAFVTGSSRGIGRETGLLLAELGAKVIFHGVSASEMLLSTVQAAGSNAEFVTADFGNMVDVKKLADDLKNRNLIPDILVLNASVQSYTGLSNFDCAEFIRMFQTNVASNCILLQELLPEMRKRIPAE